MVLAVSFIGIPKSSAQNDDAIRGSKIIKLTSRLIKNCGSPNKDTILALLNQPQLLTATVSLSKSGGHQFVVHKRLSGAPNSPFFICLDSSLLATFPGHHGVVANESGKKAPSRILIDYSSSDSSIALTLLHELEHLYQHIFFKDMAYKEKLGRCNLRP